jgi:signal transduction histidine kinase/PAS domain-containing protein
MPRQNLRPSKPPPGGRARAKAGLDTRLPDLAELSPADIRRLVHQLQLHRTELGLRGRELRQVRQALRRAQDDLEARVRQHAAALAQAERTLAKNAERYQQAETSLRAQETQLRMVLEAVGMVTWEWDVPSGTIRYSDNVRAVARGKTIAPYCSVEGLLCEVHPDDRAGLAQAVARTQDEGCLFECEYRVRMLDGAYHWIQARGKTVATGRGRPLRVLGISQDITQRKQAEQSLQRANLTLRAIRDCDEALLRATTESGLLGEICRIIVKIGVGRMVWIGYAQQDAERTVRPIAQAGFTAGFLQRARFTWGDGPRGQGPVGTAIRANRASLCRDVLADAHGAAWPREALKRGYRSLLALPLAVEKQCLGALAIYAAEADAFDAEERRLLSDLANDLALGIAALRLRAEREQLQRQLLNATEREQHRLGQDLHDGLCQMTMGTALLSEALETDLRARSLPLPVRQAQRITHLIRSIGEEARRLSRGLSPVGLGKDGLVTALAELALSTTRLFRIPTHFLGPGRVPMMEQTVATHLFRIAQEAVNNAVRHARPRTIQISLEERGGGILLTVADNGRGLPVALPAGHSMGLQIMRHRAELMGGALRLAPGRKAGTVVQCQIPPPARRPSARPRSRPARQPQGLPRHRGDRSAPSA